MFKVNEIRELIRMVDRSSIAEFSIKNGENQEFTIKKNTIQTINAEPAEMINERKEQPIQAPKAEVTAVAETGSKQEETKQDAKPENLKEIVSPMVGTFYAAPSPEDPPFIKIGDKVEDETIVCIVEAMKLFNEIEAEIKGEIVEVLVKNGELVEYGQPLFYVKAE